MKKLSYIVLPFLAFFFVFSPVQAGTIVDKAVASPDLSTLVDLVVQAGLADALSGDDKLTVFAPTNDAFSKLPAFVTSAIENNPENLNKILLYHVAAGELKASDVVNTRSIETLQGENINIRVAGQRVFANQSEVIATDILADNGVVHLVNRVLIPREILIGELVRASQELSRILLRLQQIQAGAGN